MTLAAIFVQSGELSCVCMFSSFKFDAGDHSPCPALEGHCYADRLLLPISDVVSQGSLFMISLDAQSLPPFHPFEVASLLEEPASVRGFWLDDEMLEATGLTSTPLLRKIQGFGLLSSSYVAMSVGGRRRVWTFTNVLLGQLLVRFAELARMPVQTAADWLVRPPRDWLVKAINLKELVEEAMGTPLGAVEVVGTRFVITEMEKVWFEHAPDEFALAEAPSARSDDTDPAPHTVSMDDVLRHVGTALIVDVGAINLTVCDRVRDERLAHDAARERARS